MLSPQKNEATVRHGHDCLVLKIKLLNKTTNAASILCTNSCLFAHSSKPCRLVPSYSPDHILRTSSYKKKQTLILTVRKS